MRRVPMLPCHFAANRFRNCKRPAAYMVEWLWAGACSRPLCKSCAKPHDDPRYRRELTPAERKMIPGRLP